MARARSLGIPGVAVTIATFSAYLVYAGITGTPVVEGLRELLSGRPPRGTKEPYDVGDIAAAVAGAGPAEAGVSSTSGTSATAHIESGPPVGIEQTELVRGIRVHRQIAPAVGRMIDAAKADGVTLNGAGGGWRSTATQRALRLKNGCTCSDSSSCCRVPTAPVGRSMHERGLAIDFAGVRSHSDPEWRWLNANARRWGFKNLASEPWHWSTNGR